MSQQFNDHRHEPFDDDDFETPSPSEVWPPATDAGAVSDSLPKGGGGATGDGTEFSWLEDAAELEQSMNTLRDLTKREDVATPVELNLESNAPASKSAKPRGTAVMHSNTNKTKSYNAASGTVSSTTDTTTTHVETRSTPPAQTRPNRATQRVQHAAEGELAQLWTNVFFSGELEPPKTVVVAAARQGDGATQIATSLAMLGAESNPELSIAIVDLNFRRPTVHTLVGATQYPGVTDVLTGRAKLAEAIQTIKLGNGANLYVVSSGPVADHPLSFVKSRQLKSLIGQLKDRFDHTIFDVASADRYPDAQSVGMQTNGVLLVVNAGSTPRETVAEARKRLDLAGARCLGLVLNQRTDPIPAMLYNMT